MDTYESGTVDYVKERLSNVKGKDLYITTSIVNGAQINLFVICREPMCIYFSLFGGRGGDRHASYDWLTIYMGMG